MSETKAQTPAPISVLLNPAEAAARLRTTPGVLSVWRCTRRYPLKFVRVGRRIFYRVADIEKFLDVRTETGVPAEPDSSRRSRRSR